MPEARAQLALAFDYGTRRIGLASGDSITGTSRPLTAVAVRDSGPDWRALDRQIKLLKPDVLVVGAPYNDDGSPSQIAPRVDDFATQLAARYQIAVERMDERYSSTEGASRLKELRASGQRPRALRKGDIDSAAAAILLAAWLATQRK
jgi:putative holliday junction resolvase